MFFDGAQFRNASGTTSSATAPIGLTTGDLWYDVPNQQLYVWNGSAYVLVGPQGVAGAAATEMMSANVYDTLGGRHAIIEAYSNGVVIFTISSDAAFTLDNSKNPITGFTKIQQGVTLIYTPNNGITTTNHRYWGTATNSDDLGGLPASDYVLSNNAIFTGGVHFGDAGFEVGDTPTLRVSIQSAIPVFENILGNTIVFKTTVGGVEQIPLTLVGTAVLPGQANITLGSSLVPFQSIYGTIFNGIATEANTVLLGSAYVPSSILATANTIAARDSSGNITANLFVGTATSADYADLAEKYLPDANYEVGTVMMIGGVNEVTACLLDKRAIGIISADPAFKMNASLEGGVFVALKGRVPVKISGIVNKGDELVAGANGTAMVAGINSTKVFAIALEDSNNLSVIECLVL